MRATILPYAVILAKVHRAAPSMMANGVYCSLSTGSEVFLNFTTQLYPCVCHYNLDKGEVL